MTRSAIVWVALLAGQAQGQALLKLSGTSLPKKGCDQQCVINIYLDESTADAGVDEKWVVSAQEPTQPKNLLHIPVKAKVENDIVSLTFLEASLNTLDPRKLTWNIAYIGSRGPVVAPPAPSAPSTTPKARADAEIYVSGSWLAGQGSKPLYIADAKVNIVRGKSLKYGLSADILTNTGTELPVDRTEVDPDSIKAALAFERYNNRQMGPFNGWFWNWKAVGGEFTRKHPVSNVTTNPSIGGSLRPGLLGNAWYTLYPSVGMELGRNLNKPATLFKRSVDLSGYNGIARFVVGAEGAIGIYPAKTEPKILLSASFQLRKPLTDEPFTSLEYVTNAAGSTERVKVVRLQRNSRPFTRNGLVWNLTNSWGIVLEHRYGSLPPLFELMRNQVSLGIVYKHGVARSAE